jgi:hypothetical protein
LTVTFGVAAEVEKWPGGSLYALSVNDIIGDDNHDEII